MKMSKAMVDDHVTDIKNAVREDGTIDISRLPIKNRINALDVSISFKCWLTPLLTRSETN